MAKKACNGLRGSCDRRPSWVVLGYGSGAAYAEAEFAISRPKAYLLIDVSRAVGAITTAVTASTGTSRPRDTAMADPVDWACPSGLCWTWPTAPTTSRT